MEGGGEGVVSGGCSHQPVALIGMASRDPAVAPQTSCCHCHPARGCEAEGEGPIAHALSPVTAFTDPKFSCSGYYYLLNTNISEFRDHPAVMKLM